MVNSSKSAGIPKGDVRKLGVSALAQAGNRKVPIGGIPKESGSAISNNVTELLKGGGGTLPL